MRTERLFVSSTLAMLTVDDGAVFRPTKLIDWKRDNPDWRIKLHDGSTRHVFAVTYEAQGRAEVTADCLGREVLAINLAVLTQMMCADERWAFWSESIINRRRYGWKPVKLRRWLRVFLSAADADRVLGDLSLIERLASGETLTAAAVGMERLYDLTGSVADRVPLHLRD